jgi:N-methylhydantoinase B
MNARHPPSPTLDPITVEVIRHKLDGIANEMETTLLRSSFSSIVKEGMDASASLFTLEGETLAQALAVPVHLATMIPMIRRILETFPLETMHEGDIYTMNDPYLGGTHLPDIAMIMPVFHDGRPIALTCCITHHQDVGGMAPGSIPTNSTEIFQEGLRIPPLKFREGNRVNETLIALLRQNVRIPDTFMGDLYAQVAACTVGAARLGTLAESVGQRELLAVFKELLDRSEQLTRDSLRAIAPGTYRYVDFMDNDGLNLDDRIRIEVAVTVKDGEMHCDFTGTSPQVQGPFNCVASGTLAAACWAIRALTDPSIPTNGGCFRPIHLHLPQGSILNPTAPAAVCSRTSTIKRVATAIVGAFREAIPDRVPADPGSECIMFVIGGRHADGAPFVMGEVIVAGAGAGRAEDGTDVIDTDATNSTNMPVEAIEAEFPLRIHRYGVRRDSGGPGRQRGGLGCVRVYEVLDGPLTLTHRGERHYCPAKGVDGGQAGAPAVTRILRAGGAEEVVPSKIVTTLHRGDRVIIESAGGGGWGDPRTRAREALEADLRSGKVSDEAARRVYGCAIARGLERTLEAAPLAGD